MLFAEGENACLSCDVIDGGLDVECQQRRQGKVFIFEEGFDLAMNELWQWTCVGESHSQNNPSSFLTADRFQTSLFPALLPWALSLEAYLVGQNVSNN